MWVLFTRGWVKCTSASVSVRAMAGMAVPKRDSRFSRLTDKDVQHFESILGPAGVATDPTTLEAHNVDWMHKYHGGSACVLKPQSTEQVSQILAHCNDRRLAVVPQGGNTGLVGGSVPVHDEVVLHMGRMNKVISFDAASGALVAEAGSVLGALEHLTWPQGWILPLDLGAKGSCHIGGNVSTNAGGLRLLRYGSLHGNVLGVEVVLADGRRLDLLRTLRKDNTGYDLKQLFIGAEGTLGVVTAVALQCAPRPKSVQVVLCALETFPAVTTLLATARSQLGEILSAFEFLDSKCMSTVCRQVPGITNPLTPAAGSQAEAAAAHPFYALIETHGSNSEHDTAKLTAFLEHVMESGLVRDGVVADSESQAAAIWRCREGIAEALGKQGAVYKYDVSLPVQGMYQLVEDMSAKLSAAGWGPDKAKVVGYGHVGDGNLHLNIVAQRYTDELTNLIEPYVYERVAAQNGSISAEHGLGQMKAQCIGYTKPGVAIQLMRGLKHVFDPNGILNPYKVLPL